MRADIPYVFGHRHRIDPSSSLTPISLFPTPSPPPRFRLFSAPQYSQSVQKPLLYYCTSLCFCLFSFPVDALQNETRKSRRKEKRKKEAKKKKTVTGFF